MTEEILYNPKTPDSSKREVDSSATFCCGLEPRLMSLSQNAQDWLAKTCERFADSQGYDKNEEAIKECEKADLIRKRRYYIDIPEDVFGLVYSENFFGHNDQADE